MKKTVLTFLILSFSYIQAATLVVDANPESLFFGDRSCEAGFMPDDPYSSIQDAIDDASDGDTISICDATYNESLVVDSWKNNLTIKKSDDASGDVLVQTSNTALEIDRIDNITIDGLGLNSTNQEGVYINGWSTGIVLNNLQITAANKEGISIKKDIGTLEIKNSSITAKEGLKADDAINGIKLSNVVIEATDTGIEFKKDLNNDVEFSDVEITANNGDGITFDAVINNGITIDSLEITASKKGLNFKKDVYNNFSIANTTINSVEEGIIIEGKQTNPVITNSSITSSEKDAVLTKAKNWTNFTLKNSCLTANKSGSYALQIDINKLNSDSEVSSNCFYASSSQYLAKVKGDTAGEKFDGNYWDGISGDYTQNNINDTATLESCPAICKSALDPQTPVSEFRFDACRKSDPGFSIDSIRGVSGEAIGGVDATLNAQLCNGMQTYDEGDIEAWNAFDTNLNVSAYPRGSIAFWFNSFSDWNDGPGRILVDATKGNKYFFIGLTQYGKIKFYYEDERDRDYQSYSDGTFHFDKNRWHHIAVAWDSYAGKAEVYLDGSRITMNVTQNTLGGNGFDGAYGDLVIGDVREEYTQNSSVFDGLKNSSYGVFDEVKIYDSMLSDALVKQLYDYELQKLSWDGSSRSCIDCIDQLPVCFVDTFERDTLHQKYGGEGWLILQDDNFTPQLVNGRLRLTDSTENVATAANLKPDIISKNNVFTIEFNHFAYDDSDDCSGDGVTLTLSDASVTPDTGGYGGSLGYAQRNNAQGFAGGWLGIGLDEYGNYSNPTEGREGGTGFTEDAVAIRGAQGADRDSGYKFIAGTPSLSANPIADPDSTTPSPGDKYRIIVDTRNDKTLISIDRDINDGSGYQRLVNQTDATQLATSPERFIMTWTAGTGGCRNIHEVDNLIFRADDCGEFENLEEVDPNVFFDAWDIDSSVVSKEIETKKVQEGFDLTIAPLDETATAVKNFSGTLCAQLVDNAGSALTPWQKLLYGDEGEKTVHFSVGQASKDVRVQMAWKSGEDLSCPLTVGSESNTTLSSDNFALRPEKFTISVPANAYAGEDFTIDLQALGSDTTPANGYDETLDTSFTLESNVTKAGCSSGTLTTDPFNFTSGIGSANGSYSDVGEVNVKIRELQGSEFASVDSDDTPLSKRLIGEAVATVEIKPYELNIINFDYNVSNGNGWLYMGDTADMNVSVGATVEAANKNHNPVQNFTALCYAKDVDIAFHYSLQADAQTRFSYVQRQGTIDSYDKNVSDINKTITIDANAFSTPSATASYVFGVDKNISVERNPAAIVLLDINSTSTAVSKVQNGAVDAGLILANENNTTFYYARVHPLDTVTTQVNDRTTAYIDVYSANGSSVSGLKQSSLDWYRFSPDDSVVGDFGTVANATGIKNDANPIFATNIIDVSNAAVNISMQNPAAVNDGVIHLDIPGYLWYSSAQTQYNSANGSSCTAHPCILYTLLANGGNSVQTGRFNGSDVNTTTPGGSLPKGVKIFR